LLGAGESGKSTIFKQMNVIHGKGFSEAERKGKYKKIIHDNVFASIKTLCEMCGRFGGRVNPHLQASKQYIEDLKDDEYSLVLSPAIAAHIAALWADPAIQATFEQRSHFQLNENTRPFLDHVQEIGRADYLPTMDDVLLARVRTTGIAQKDFVIDGNKFSMFDVGGQRNERKKWIHCFDSVTAVLFVASLSEYDQVLYEDEDTNRMTEALRLFEQMCNSKYFGDTNMILFLNKRDLFAEKIKKVPITHCFPEYHGSQTYEECSEFIKDSFIKLNETKKTVYSHFTCATDTNNVQVVFDAVKDIVLTSCLKDAGLVS